MDKLWNQIKLDFGTLNLKHTQGKIKCPQTKKLKWKILQAQRLTIVLIRAAWNPVEITSLQAKCRIFIGVYLF